MVELECQLAEGIAQLGLALSAEQQAQLLRYVQLLAKWNQAYNLTAVRRVPEMINRHLLDSLSIIPYLPGTRVLDVGTGPGLPGIPLAIACPDKHLSLLDSGGKKIRFLTQVCHQLGLANVECVHSRVEALHTAAGYEVIVSRAFAALTDFLSLTQHLCAKNGRFVAMKGQYPTEELSRLPKSIKVHQLVLLKVPGNEGQRHVVVMSTGDSANPPTSPRRAKL